jgi:hypothetical protein
MKRIKKGSFMKLGQEDFAEIVAALQPVVSEPTRTSDVAGQIENERRHAARASISANVQGWSIQPGKIGRAFTSLAENISLVGIELMSCAPMPPGQELILSLPRLNGEPLYWCAVVARCSPSARGMRCGLEFCGPAPEQAVKAIARSARTAPAACKAVA